jgi:DNA replication protein DnaC
MIASQLTGSPSRRFHENKSHVGYLGSTTAGREGNPIERRILEAHLPRVKTLEEFDYTQSPNVTAAKMRNLAEVAISIAPNRAYSSAGVVPASPTC